MNIELYDAAGPHVEPDGITLGPQRYIPDPAEELVTVTRLGFIGRMKRRAVLEAVARGASEADATAVVAELGDGRFLEWLMNGGLEKIIELILKILAVVA